MLGTFFATVAVAVGGFASPAVNADLPGVGERYGRLVIPAIGVDQPIVQGTGHRQLKRGIGHIVESYFPGMGRKTMLFAHNVTPTRGLPYGIFHLITLLSRGDRVVAKMPYGRYVYRVTKQFRVRVRSEGEWERLRKQILVQADGDGDTLIMAKCWPDYSRAYRWIVVAERSA